MRARYEFKLLGPLEVRRDGLPVPLGATKLRVLLATLLLEAGRVVPVDTLTERLWGEEPPGRARNTLQNYVLRLRRALGPGVVLTHPQGYLIEAGPDCLDLLRFNALVREGRTALSSGSVEHAAALLGEARGLWRGEPLSDLPAELVRNIAPALAEQRLDGEELWIEAELALGRSAAVLPELRTLVCVHPLRERFWAQRMLALYRCGRQGEALECYREVTALLAEELGIDPCPELRTLHGKLLAAAPELGVPGGGVGAGVGLGVGVGAGAGAEAGGGAKAGGGAGVGTGAGVGVGAEAEAGAGAGVGAAARSGAGDRAGVGAEAEAGAGAGAGAEAGAGTGAGAGAGAGTEAGAGAGAGTEAGAGAGAGTEAGAGAGVGVGAAARSGAGDRAGAWVGAGAGAGAEVGAGAGSGAETSSGAGLSPGLRAKAGAGAEGATGLAGTSGTPGPPEDPEAAGTAAATGTPSPSEEAPGPPGATEPPDPHRSTKPQNPPSTTEPPGPHRSTKPQNPPSTTEPPGPHRSTKPQNPPSTTEPPGPHRSTKPQNPPGTTELPRPHGSTEPQDPPETSKPAEAAADAGPAAPGATAAHPAGPSASTIRTSTAARRSGTTAAHSTGPSTSPHAADPPAPYTGNMPAPRVETRPAPHSETRPAPHTETPPAPHTESLPAPHTGLPHTSHTGNPPASQSGLPPAPYTSTPPVLPVPPTPPIPCTPCNLPAETTTFVGREPQLAHARALLATSRLVSLTGVGGVGKTRLALRVAAEAAGGAAGSRSARPSDLFPDGVWLADLAPLAEPALLDRAVAASLDLRDQSARPAADAVADHLRDRRLLLVLDNCEHLVEAVATLVLRLLRAAPGLRVLATSRERLGVPGEHVLLVPSLTLPHPQGLHRLHGPYASHKPHGSHGPYGPHGSCGSGRNACADSSEAFRLLVERARAAAPAFRVTDRNSGALAQLCHRLDGIPLAVELAAVRLGTMAPEEILDRLDDRFRLLSVPHTRTAPTRYQQTLRGVVDWSHDLCTEDERLLWARLSIFSGSFDLEAVEAVCTGGEGDAEGDEYQDGNIGTHGTHGTHSTHDKHGIAHESVLDLLTGLVDKSIVMVETDADGRSPRARYRLLETIRQYGRHRLRSTEQQGPSQDATTALRLRHCAHYRSLTARAAAEWCGPDEADWLSRLDHDLPNLRAALDFCGTQPGRAVVGLEIAVNLTRTRSWFFSSTLGEGRHWLERLRGQVDDVPQELELAVAAMQAWIALCQGDDGAPRTLTGEQSGPPELLGPPRPTAPTGPASLPDHTGPAAPAAPALFIEGAHSMLVRAEPASIDILVRARAGFLAAGQTGDAHMCTMLWAMAAAFLGDRETAFRSREVYVAEAERSGAYWAQTWAHWSAGVAELRHGDPARAIAPMRGALVRQHGLGDRWGPVWNVESLAWAVAATGHHHHRAARLLGAAHRLREITGIALIGLRPLHDVHLETVELVRTALGPQGYEEAWERGTAAEDLVALALELTDDDAAPCCDCG